MITIESYIKTESKKDKILMSSILFTKELEDRQLCDFTLPLRSVHDIQFDLMVLYRTMLMYKSMYVSLFNEILRLKTITLQYVPVYEKFKEDNKLKQIIEIQKDPLTADDIELILKCSTYLNTKDDLEKFHKSFSEELINKILTK